MIQQSTWGALLVAAGMLFTSHHAARLVGGRLAIAKLIYMAGLAHMAKPQTPQRLLP